MQIHPVSDSITKTLAISDKICVVVNTALHLKLWGCTCSLPFLNLPSELNQQILLHSVLLHLLQPTIIGYFATTLPYAKNFSLQVRKILYSLFVSLLDYDGNQQFFVPSCWLGNQHFYHFIFSAHAAFSCHLIC